MSVFDSEATNLMSSALHKAVNRLRTLGLVDDDAAGANAILSKLILEAVERGERDEENLIRFAIGRFRSDNVGGRGIP